MFLKFLEILAMLQSCKEQTDASIQSSLTDKNVLSDDCKVILHVSLLSI